MQREFLPYMIYQKQEGMRLAFLYVNICRHQYPTGGPGQPPSRAPVPRPTEHAGNTSTYSTERAGEEIYEEKTDSCRLNHQCEKALRNELVTGVSLIQRSSVESHSINKGVMSTAFNIKKVKYLGREEILTVVQYIAKKDFLMSF